MKYKLSTGSSILMAGIFFLLALQGCSENGQETILGAANDRSKQEQLKIPEASGIEAIDQGGFSTTAGNGDEIEFKYEFIVSTTVMSLDIKGGKLLIEFDPKTVIINSETIIFERANAGADFGSSTLTAVSAEGSTTISGAVMLSLEDISIGSAVNVFAYKTDNAVLYAVAIELRKGFPEPESIYLK